MFQDSLSVFRGQESLKGAKNPEKGAKNPEKDAKNPEKGVFDHVLKKVSAYFHAWTLARVT